MHPGTAYTLVTEKDTNFAWDLVRNLELSKQKVPDELRALASRAKGGRRGGGDGEGKGNRRTAGIGFGGSEGGASNLMGFQPASTTSGSRGGGGRYSSVSPPEADEGPSHYMPNCPPPPPPEPPKPQEPLPLGGGNRKRRSRWEE